VFCCGPSLSFGRCWGLTYDVKCDECGQDHVEFKAMLLHGFG